MRDSRFKGSANFQNVVSLANSAKGNDLKGYRGEFVDLVNKASRLKG